MNLAIVGNGRMGALLKEKAEELGHTVIWQGDCTSNQSIPDCGAIVDFSHPDNLDWVLDTTDSIPYVCGTTGLSEAQMDRLHAASESRPIFWSANYSVGIAVLKQLLEKAAGSLAGFDVEIIETHHNKKQDAPSGTALSLADSIDPEGKRERVYGRSGICPRTEDSIGIHAVRGGTVPGNHEVLFLGPDETVSLSHSAGSRLIFVNGALKAVEFLEGKEPGFYSMPDLLEVK